MHVHTYKHARILARTHVYAHRDRQRENCVSGKRDYRTVFCFLCLFLIFKRKVFKGYLKELTEVE